MAHLQLLRQIADRQFAVCGECADGKKRLILVRSQVLAAEEVFAESEETPYLVTERGEAFKVYGVHAT